MVSFRKWHGVAALAVFAGCSLGFSPSSESELIAKSDQLLAAGESTDAEQLFVRHLEKHPEWRGAQERYASLLVQNGRASSALPILERLVNEAPTAELHYQLGLAQHALGLDSKRAFDAAVKLDPQHLGALTALGILEEEAGKLERARGSWEAVVAIDPTYAPAQANLGRLSAKKRQYNRAEQYYLAAVNASPSFGKAVAGLGLVYRAQGRDDAALGVWRKAADNPQTAAEVLPLLVDLLNETGLGGEATKVLEASVARGISDPQIYLLLAAQYQAAEPAKSLETLEKAAERFSDVAAVQVELGKALIKSGDSKRAEAALRTAIRLQPDASEAASLIGALMVSEGRLDEALPLYEALCQAEGATGESHLILGGIYSSLEREDEALDQWNRAVALEPDLAAAHLQLARAYAERRDRERSLKSYKRFLHLAEKSPSTVEVPEGIQEEIMKVSAGAP